jgi:hypothetical protein
MSEWAGEDEMANLRAGVRRPRCACRLARVLPDEFWRHHRAARRERLLSWRSVLDAAAARLEELPAATGETAGAELIPDSFWAHRQAAREEDLLAVRSVVDGLLSWWEAWLEEPPPAETVRRVEVE